MDNDAKMLDEMGTALTKLQIKYRQSDLMDRMLLKPSLDELIQDYSQYQLKLLKEGIISTDDDLAEMRQLKKDIDQAAQTQQLAEAIVKTIAFVATKMA